MTSGYAKVILFGEHSVVYGHPALAAALSATVSVRTVSAHAGHAVGLDPRPDIYAPGDGSRLGTALGHLIDVMGGSDSAPTGTVWLESAVPIGAGLGSSAAMAVALARHYDPTADIETVLEAARAWESVFHKNPSGVDHTTSALGGVIEFCKGRSPEFRRLEIEPLPLVIGQIDQGADTSVMVEGVRRRLDRRPGPMRAALGLLGECAVAAQPALICGDVDTVGELMDIAHGGLTAIGVSTPGLDAACATARAAGATGAKLTGAGGGGCIIAACHSQHISAVQTALTDAGAIRVLYARAGVNHR